MKEKAFDIALGKKGKLACYLTLPEAKTFPLLVCIHGLCSAFHREIYISLRDQLVRRGWGVLGFDLRAHGNSSGNLFDITVDQSVADVRAIIAYAKKLKGVESLSLFGRSYGGLLAIVMAMENQSIFLLGLSAPVTDYIEQRGFQLTKQQLADWKNTGYTSYQRANNEYVRIGYDFYLSAMPYHKNFPKLIPKIPSTTMIIQGDADERIPLTLTQQFFDSLACEKEIVVVHGADHGFSDPTHRKNMINHFREFYTEHL
jgi:hypothetical protein